MLKMRQLPHSVLLVLVYDLGQIY